LSAENYIFFSFKVSILQPPGLQPGAAAPLAPTPCRYTLCRRRLWCILDLQMNA